MGRKNHRGNDHELKEVQKLRFENQKLRKQISQLRKQMSRIDIDRYSHLKDIIEAHDEQDSQFDKEFELKQLKDKWMCHDCGRDYLRIVIVPRADGVFYFRRCINCSHRTKLKKYSENVEGIDTNDKPINKNSKIL